MYHYLRGFYLSANVLKCLVPSLIFIALCLIFVTGLGGLGVESIRYNAASENNSLPSDVNDENTAVIPEEPSMAEKVTRALVEAYPRRVLRTEFRDGDWAVLLRDTWFYYAEGRLLPEEIRHRALEFRPVGFYQYPKDLPEWKHPTDEQISRYRAMGDTVQPARANYFFDALYRASSHSEADQRVKTIRFLGNSITVHYAIIEDLVLVEEAIRAAARTSLQVGNWVQNIGSMESWHWRDVAGTQSRSFHSYGIALDILPRSYQRKQVYWRWAGSEWWNIPYEDRYQPPDAVVKIFEAHGFVWGGKWAIYDTIHFEYRPDVLLLSGINLTTMR